MCHFQTDIGAAGTNVPIREKAHSGVSPAGAAKNAARGISLKVLLMQNFQTAATVLTHRLPHSAKPHARILPQRGIDMFIKNDICYADELKEGIKITDAKPLRGGMMLVTFSTGEQRLFDTTLLQGSAFEPLKDENIFRNLVVFHGVLTWANGEIDIASETVYMESYAYNKETV
jgi:hypothetical protein